MTLGNKGSRGILKGKTKVASKMFWCRVDKNSDDLFSYRIKWFGGEKWAFVLVFC